MLSVLVAKVYESPGGRCTRPNKFHVGRGMVEFDKNAQVFGKLPRGKHSKHGRGRKLNGERTNGIGHNARRSPEENNEQCTEYSRSNQGERLGGFPRLRVVGVGLL